jgi:hypothetical protein
MRRSVSIAVLSVMLISVLAPLVQAQFFTLPACCRAGGKHHCEMSLGPSETIGFKSVPVACPYRHPAAVISEVVALPEARHSTGIFVLSSDAPRASEETFSANLSDDAHKRGPPTA